MFAPARVVVRVVLDNLRDMALCHECGMRLTAERGGMRLTADNIAAIEAEIAAGPSYAYVRIATCCGWVGR